MEAGQIIESGMPDKFFGNTRAEGARDALSKILAP